MLKIISTRDPTNIAGKSIGCFEREVESDGIGLPRDDEEREITPR